MDKKHKLSDMGTDQTNNLGRVSLQLLAKEFTAKKRDQK